MSTTSNDQVGPGLLAATRLVPVPALRVTPPASAGGPAWAKLDAGDFRARGRRPTQILLHSTKGIWPQRVIPGAGPTGRARLVADFWSRDATHSAAQLVIGSDGEVACLADLVEDEAYHATVSNPYSVGIEIYQEADGGIYEAAYEALVQVVPAICAILGVPFQVATDPYTGHPIPRFLDGGPTYRGVLCHRDNTEARGRGDPGDEAVRRLVEAGAEPVLAGEYQDLSLGRARQRHLNALGEQLVVDGLVGPASLAAAVRRGFARWRDVPAA